VLVPRYMKLNEKIQNRAELGSAPEHIKGETKRAEPGGSALLWYSVPYPVVWPFTFWLYASSFARTCRPWAIRFVPGMYASSLDCMHHPGIVHVVLWSYALSWDRRRRPGAVRVVLGPYVLSLGRTCRAWAAGIVLSQTCHP